MMIDHYGSLDRPKCQSVMFLHKDGEPFVRVTYRKDWFNCVPVPPPQVWHEDWYLENNDWVKRETVHAKVTPGSFVAETVAWPLPRVE